MKDHIKSVVVSYNIPILVTPVLIWWELFPAVGRRIETRLFKRSFPPQAILCFFGYFILGSTIQKDCQKDFYTAELSCRISGKMSHLVSVFWHLPPEFLLQVISISINIQSYQ